MSITAAVLINTNTPLEIINNIKIPVLRKGQVLVKIQYAGLCHSQLMEAEGLRGKDYYLPHMMGHEGVGEVLETGSEVCKLKPGDRVVLGWLKGAGTNEGGSVYQSPIGNINAGPVTAFSNMAVISENRCYLIPKDIPPKIGVLLGCAIPTGYGIIMNQVQSTAASHIAIIGLGGIGLSALIATLKSPHKTIIAIDTNSAKLTLAKQLGAVYCLNPKTQDLAETINDITKGHMLDFVVEAAGSCSTIELGFELLNPQNGTCIFASHPPTGKKIQLDPHHLICGKQIRGSWGGNSNPEQVISQFHKQQNWEELHPLISDGYQLSTINQAFQDLKSQNVTRAIIEMPDV